MTSKGKPNIEMNMKRLIVLFMCLMGSVAMLQATDGDEQQRLSLEEFRAKQQAYITEKAGLTPEEAAKFFPAYFELQEKKKQLNDKVWELLRKGKGENVSEIEYEEIMEGVYENRIASDRLEKSYFESFKKILSCKKIYLVQKAEMRFHRELLRGMKEGKPQRDNGK